MTTHRGNLWKNYGLSLTLAALFIASWIAQGAFQWVHESQEAQVHGQVLTAGEYWPSFFAATMENWQSEFLQLLTFVVLTSFLIHKGSHESKDSDEDMQRQLDRIEERLKAMQ